MTAAKERLVDWISQVVAWDFARQKDLQREIAAKGYGLNPLDYRQPFPGSTPNVVAPQYTVQQSGGSGLGKALAAGVLATGVGMGGLGLGLALSDEQPPPAAPPPVEFHDTDTDTLFDLRIVE